MKNNIKIYLEESINLELNMSELYQLFYVKYPEDAQFWWELSLEEISHASLIRSLNDLFLPEEIFHSKGIENKIEKLNDINYSIRKKINEFRTNQLPRYKVFMYAIELENSFGEIHFQMFMNDLPISGAERIFQKLNVEDKNHAQRITNYMKMNNIT